MAITFEKPLKDFLKNFQKDLNLLQKTLKKESDDLLKRVKTAANKEQLQARRYEIENLIEKNLKKYEPTISKFVTEMNKSAKKAGVDLTQLERKVKDNLQAARSRLGKGGRKPVAKGAKAKKTTGTRKAASTRKPAAKKAAESTAARTEAFASVEASDAT